MSADDNTMSMAGTPLFAAPELLRGERYDETADVWSFGCVLESLTTRKLPYFERCEREPGLGQRPALRVAEGTLRPTLPPDALFAELVGRCVDSWPERRPRFDWLSTSLGQPGMRKAAEAHDRAAALARGSVATELSCSTQPDIDMVASGRPSNEVEYRGARKHSEQEASASSQGSVSDDVRLPGQCCVTHGADL